MQERKKRPPLRKAEPLPAPMAPRSEEEEEKRACGMAMDLAMKWLQEGTAPAQVVVHFLKLQTTREKVELEKWRRSTTKLSQPSNPIPAKIRIGKLYRMTIRTKMWTTVLKYEE